jgi:quinoprotein glucose dehydrogenase
VNAGFQHRGVAYWRERQAVGGGSAGTPRAVTQAPERIFIATHDRRLLAIDAHRGQLVPSFGQDGAVALANDLGREIDWRAISHSSPPAVCNDAVVVGSTIRDYPNRQESPPGHVRAYDARTGAMLWIFHTIPQPGEEGHATWEEESWRYTGAANVWGTISADEELGLVYLATGTPTNDYYGGHRLGDNLFAESLVAVDCRTGKKAWHFQAVHHGLWDYDFPTAPTLFDLTQPDGTVYQGLAAPSKQAFLYVLDRRTGEPRWPIQEQPVPQTDVPGERTSPTQPIPTRPAPFDRQGVTADDLIDFTPELRAEALAIVSRFKLGPIFTPPIVGDDDLVGTLQLPGTSGGAWWPGAALDPATGAVFVPSITNPIVASLVAPDPARSDFRYALAGDNFPEGPQGLPLFKPPYGRVTAIDMHRGNHLWMTPNGEGPRDHPALRHLDLPPLGSRGLTPIGGGGPLATKTLLFVGQGGTWRESAIDRIPKLNVFDKSTGQHLGYVELPDNPYGNPITYLIDGRQFLVEAVGGGRFSGRDGPPGELIALTLPEPVAKPGASSPEQSPDL